MIEAEVRFWNKYYLIMIQLEEFLNSKYPDKSILFTIEDLNSGVGYELVINFKHDKFFKMFWDDKIISQYRKKKLIMMHYRWPSPIEEGQIIYSFDYWDKILKNNILFRLYSNERLYRYKKTVRQTKLNL